MESWQPGDVGRALRASWAADTCSPDDAERAPWTPENPAWGHCDITALMVHDLFGGDFLLGEVWLDGHRHGYHAWNLLPGRLEVDLTRDQFRLGQEIVRAQTQARPPGRPPRRAEAYRLLRRRVEQRLGRTLPPPRGAA